MPRGIFLAVSDRGEEWIVPFKLYLWWPHGIGGEETPGRLHVFAFTSGMRKDEVNNNNKEEKTLLMTLTVGGFVGGGRAR